MDELVRRYLLLALRLGRHVPSFLLAYVGPPGLREALDGEDPTPARELHDESMRLAELVVGALGPDATRAGWLRAQLQAMGALARTIDGEEIGYLDLVEELYDVRLEREPLDTFVAAHRMLDAALPAGPGLRERLAAHEAATALASLDGLAAVRRLADLLRRRTAQDLWLPDGESVEFIESSIEFAYLGGFRSVVGAALDRPMSLRRVVELAAGQTYPGRHAERAVKEAVLMREHGFDEAAVTCRFTPEAVISGGIAAVGREVVLTDQELAVELGRIGRAAGVRIDADRELAVARAREHLAPALANAAIGLHHEGAPVREVRDELGEVALLDSAALDVEMRRLAHPLSRADPVTRFAGARLVREWLQVQGQTHGLSRLLAEQLTPGRLRSEAA